MFALNIFNVYEYLDTSMNGSYWVDCIVLQELPHQLVIEYNQLINDELVVRVVTHNKVRRKNNGNIS